MSRSAAAKAPLPSAAGADLQMRSHVLWLLVLGVVGLLVYANALHNPFLWDDPYLIRDNYLIRSLRYLPEVFSQHLYHSTAGLSNFYRPLQIVFLMVDYAFWGMNPLGYHLSSLLMHVLCAWMAYLIVAHVLKRSSLALLVSLYFVVHPINSTVVDYVASRADSQATLCMLAALWMFFRAGSSPRASWYLGSLGVFILALLSKELAMVFPIWLLASAFMVDRRLVRRTIPFFIVLGIYGVLRLTILSFPEPSTMVPPPLGTRLLTTAESLVRLMGLMIWPHSIHIEKSIPFATGLFQLRTLGSIALLVVVGLGMVWSRRRARICYFGLVWFFITLLPMANIIPINTTLADHWLYLPGIGFLLAVFGGAADWIGNRPVLQQRAMTRIAIGASGVVLLVFAGLTVRQNTLWGDPERFFHRGLEISPKSYRLHNELGVIFLGRDDYTQAAGEFREAIALNPAFDQAHDNLGVALDHLGDLEGAIAQHHRALELNPGNPKVYNNLGNAYLKLRRWEEAIQVYEQALELNPSYLAVYSNLGAVYFSRGQHVRAKELWEQALRIDPAFEPAANNLRLLSQQGGSDDAP